MRTAWGRDEHTTIALALPVIWRAILVRKCSTMISAFWARLSGCRVTKRARRAAGLGGVVGRVVEDGLLQVVVPVVGDVAGQHVADEALLDGLAHRIQMERLVAAAAPT